MEGLECSSICYLPIVYLLFAHRPERYINSRVLHCAKVRTIERKLRRFAASELCDCAYDNPAFHALVSAPIQHLIYLVSQAGELGLCGWDLHFRCGIGSAAFLSRRLEIKSGVVGGERGDCTSAGADCLGFLQGTTIPEKRRRHWSMPRGIAAGGTALMLGKIGW